MLSKLPINLESLMRQRQVEGDRIEYKAGWNPRYEDRNLLVLWAAGGTHRPYKVPKSVIAKLKEYRYYIRRYSSTIEARGEDERELIGLTASVPFQDISRAMLLLISSATT
ncbi:MAG: hypothetical protein Q7V56_01035 [Gammaproteobacteria bacterium]|nr:hypothetical protein [Gammaproteobacteria bacterium]